MPVSCVTMPYGIPPAYVLSIFPADPPPKLYNRTHRFAWSDEMSPREWCDEIRQATGSIAEVRALCYHDHDGMRGIMALMTSRLEQ